jgi:hypothetical protein
MSPTAYCQLLSIIDLHLTFTFMEKAMKKGYQKMPMRKPLKVLYPLEALLL